MTTKKFHYEEKFEYKLVDGYGTYHDVKTLSEAKRLANLSGGKVVVVKTISSYDEKVVIENEHKWFKEVYDEVSTSIDGEEQGGEVVWTYRKPDCSFSSGYVREKILTGEVTFQFHREGFWKKAQSVNEGKRMLEQIYENTIENNPNYTFSASARYDQS